MILSIFWTPEIISCLDDRSREAVLQHACYSPFFVPESMRANLIFREMREKRDYFAVVLDEYGCFVGIVTLHDLVETLVGDIDDRTDLPKPDDIEEDRRTYLENTGRSDPG